MSNERAPSLEHLLEIVPRDEIERIVARRGRAGAVAFSNALHWDLDHAIERLESVAQHYANDSAEKLTNFLVVQLASIGYNVTCKTDDDERVNLRIENLATGIVWIAIAFLYESCSQNLVGILRLFEQTSGRHAQAGLLLYIRKGGAAQIVDEWTSKLRNDHRAACHAVGRSSNTCILVSEHTHPSSMFPITVRHHVVLLDRPGSVTRSSPLERRKQKHTVLFLAANPCKTDHLALDREAHAIRLELERSGYRECFEFVTRWAMEPLDLLRELRKLKPTVVHFSGNGSRNVASSRRGGAGVFLPGPNGRAQLVSTVALKESFGAAGASVKLVILNACYTEMQANALIAHVDCVVGMSGSIRDEVARSFALGFYGALGERESIAVAYRQACAAVSLEGLGDAEQLQHKICTRVDVSQIVLAAEPSQSE